MLLSGFEGGDQACRIQAVYPRNSVQAMADFVAAIDQGTTSTRCMIFDHSGREVGKSQLEHRQIMPRAGWVEHDPLEIWQRTQRSSSTPWQAQPWRHRPGGARDHQPA